jgi:hypothetical protein
VGTFVRWPPRRRTTHEFREHDFPFAIKVMRAAIVNARGVGAKGSLDMV